MKRPDWVSKESLWKKHCRRVVARTNELLAGTVEPFGCAQEIVKLEFWLRAEDDLDFQLFRQLAEEGEALLANNAEANLAALNGAWQDRAVMAAKSLHEQYIDDTELQ